MFPKIADLAILSYVFGASPWTFLELDLPGHEAVVRVLLAAKANPEARNNYSPCSCTWGIRDHLPSGYVKIAIENGHL